MNAITFLTCRRFNLFQETIKSLSEKCLDMNTIDLIIHYDDSSSDEDRRDMTKLLRKLFPQKLIMEKYFEQDSFATNKRSMEIMNRWQIDLTKLNVDYVLHMEDDWRFDYNFSIQEVIDILEKNDDIAYIGYHQQYREKIEELYGKPDIIGNYWKWLYLPEMETCCNVFLDKEEMALQNDPHFWCYYINWPYYSFRPGIHDMKKINTLGNFDYDTGAVELEFAKKYSKKFSAYYHMKRLCFHTGQYYSAFDINKSQR